MPRGQVTIHCPIHFDPKQTSNVVLMIYNMFGQKIVEEAYGRMSAGSCEKITNMESLSSGDHLYRLETISDNGERFTSSKKLLFLK